ncbi:Ankyrin-like protein [Hapsidospora chrysogenum ATCC 11550]|uniref:Ankyrin-like protein n=1 Tax=Hapsidospora chrysogenum (strain ATCC 11550 / CBS 779.69 / DSM 880 / IAM 14645 / JCM 23072 / IMI 49137) TaxID=857340 RepID=A0A086SYC2_HAPC1|nr:Ankyrin-like protein [Hapsidospora chrysogenum ATCC 11550]
MHLFRLAAGLDRGDLMRLLLDHDASKDAVTVELLRALLETVANLGHEGVLRHLLQHRLTNILLTYAFFRKLAHIAGTCGHLSVLRCLLLHRRRTVVGWNTGMTPFIYSVLQVAAPLGHATIVRMLLLVVRVEPTAPLTPAELGRLVQVTAPHGHTDVVELLLHCGADPDRRTLGTPMSALSGATLGGHIGVVKALLRYNVSPETRHPDQPKPLPLAASRGHLNIVQLLLENGAEIEAEAWGHTALVCAVENGHTEVVRRLLQWGALTNVQNANGRTLFEIAQARRDDTILNLISDRVAGRLDPF